MVTVFLGVLAFLLGIFADYVPLQGLGHLKKFLWGLISLLLAYAHLAVALDPDKVSLPGWTRWPGVLLLVASAFLLFYSLFLEIPFSQAYAQASADNQLVQQGTYAATRHPGVLWYAMMLVGLALVSWSRLAIVAAPVWLLMDVLWVWIEDRFLFERMIDGYGEYKKTTPMLIPTRASMVRCWRTLALRRMIADGLGPGTVK